MDFPEELLAKITQEKRDGLMELLSQDPRPQYQNDPERVYKMKFGSQEVWFKVEGTMVVVTNIQ